MLDRERLSAITDNVVYDEPMSKHTTFRIGGTADAFVSPENALEIEKIIHFAKIPIHRICLWATAQICLSVTAV